MRQTAARTLGRPEGKSERIARNQTAAQILKQMKRAERNSRGQNIRIARQFKDLSQEKTAKGIYSFLRHGMVYKKEPNSRQTVKETTRYIADGFGDCKHYATFAVGVLNACGIPAWFVLVSQHRGRSSPNHAYCQCMIHNTIYTIDPCRARFDSECMHFKKYMLPPHQQN